MWWHPLEFLPPWALIALFPFFWVAVSALIGLISGWTRLSETYRHEGTFSGKTWRSRSGAMRWGMGYSNILTVGANEKGLYLAVFVPFRIGHPSLFVPWSDVVMVGSKGWLVKQTELRFARVPEIPVRLPQELVNSISTEAGQHWQRREGGVPVQLNT